MKIQAGTYLVKAISKAGNEYVALYYDIGWRKIYITMKKDEIAELLDIKVRELEEFLKQVKLNEPIKVA